MDVIEWLQASGYHLQVPAIMWPRDKLNPQFIKVFDLSPPEVARLEGSLKLAKEQIDALLSRAATGEISADGAKLTVTVPPQPTEGGVIHDTLLSAFEQVLGPDRFLLFNTMSGDAFEQSFDQFGLATEIFTVDLNPERMSGGRPLYQVKKETKGAEGRLNNNSIGRIDAAGVLDFAPPVKRFLPADFGQPVQPPPAK